MSTIPTIPTTTITPITPTTINWTTKRLAIWSIALVTLSVAITLKVRKKIIIVAEDYFQNLAGIHNRGNKRPNQTCNDNNRGDTAVLTKPPNPLQFMKAIGRKKNTNFIEHNENKNNNFKRLPHEHTDTCPTINADLSGDTDKVHTKPMGAGVKWTPL